MFKRRVQVIGDTFLISIPKEWAKLHGLKRQDEVFLEISPDLSLIIIPPSKSVKQRRTDSIELELVGNLRYDLMNIISKYLVGYDEFYVRVNLNNPSYLKLFQEELTTKVLGLEVVSFEENLIIVKNVAGDFSISVKEIIERLFKLLDSTLKDLLLVIKSNDFNENKLQELADKDSLADKLTLYSLRTLNKILMGEHLPREHGFSSFLEVNIVYDMLRNLERSIDHVTYIARDLLRSQFNFSDDDKILVVKHIETLIEFSILVKKLVEDFQYETVYSTISSKYNELIQIEDKYVNILKKNPQMFLILDNLRRVKAYLYDIVELMMDKNAMLTKIQEILK